MAAEPVRRPWGAYQVIDSGAGYCVKRITITAGQRLSYQRHRRRSEHWFVVAGSGVATIDDRDLSVEIGSTVDIPVGTAHRIGSDEGADLLFVEVQTGDYFGEDDIERLDDDYGR